MNMKNNIITNQNTQKGGNKKKNDDEKTQNGNGYAYGNGSCKSRT